MQAAGASGSAYSLTYIAFLGLATGLLFASGARSRHDEFMQSPAGLWHNPPAWLRLIARKGPGPVRILSLVQSGIALSLAISSAAALAGVVRGRVGEVIVEVPMLLTIFGTVALWLIDWLVGLWWDRGIHAQHLKLLRALGLNTALTTCLVIWLRNEIDPAVFRELTAPWSEVLGDLPDADIPAG